MGATGRKTGYGEHHADDVAGIYARRFRVRAKGKGTPGEGSFGPNRTQIRESCFRENGGRRLDSISKWRAWGDSNARPLVPEISPGIASYWFAWYLAAPEYRILARFRRLSFPNLSQLFAALNWRSHIAHSLSLFPDRHNSGNADRFQQESAIETRHSDESDRACPRLTPAAPARWVFLHAPSRRRLWIRTEYL